MMKAKEARRTMGKTELSGKPAQADKPSMNNIMNECEAYRKKLIKHLQIHFNLEYEQAEDCVQDAYVALFESLVKGIKIKNYRAWLYQVATNYKNKVLREKIKQNEYEFVTNEEKDKAIESAAIYTPDYADNMVSDEMIEERAIKILSSLSREEKELFKNHYWKNKTFAEIAAELGLNASTISKRHGRIKRKILNMIQDYEKS